MGMSGSRGWMQWTYRRRTGKKLEKGGIDFDIMHYSYSILTICKKKKKKKKQRRRINRIQIGSENSIGISLGIVQRSLERVDKSEKALRLGA